MGKISYSVYLCQGVIFWYVSDYFGNLFPLLTIILVYFLSYLSYKVIEEPGIALGKRLYRWISSKKMVTVPEKN